VWKIDTDLVNWLIWSLRMAFKHVCSESRAKEQQKHFGRSLVRLFGSFGHLVKGQTKDESSVSDQTENRTEE
jgi:hypothetical protein